MPTRGRQEIVEAARARHSALRIETEQAEEVLDRTRTAHHLARERYLDHAFYGVGTEAEIRSGPTRR